jgi:hypothetical protein
MACCLVKHEDCFKNVRSNTDYMKCKHESPLWWVVAISLGPQRPDHEADHWLQSGAELKHSWGVTFTSPPPHSPRLKCVVVKQRTKLSKLESIMTVQSCEFVLKFHTVNCTKNFYRRWCLGSTLQAHRGAYPNILITQFQKKFHQIRDERAHHTSNVYEDVSKSYRTESITKQTTINTRWEATQMVLVAKLNRLTHKIAIQLHLVADKCTIRISRSRWPVQKLLDTPS